VTFFKRLTKDLDPRVSFSDALEELVKRIDSKTNGKVKRIAFCMDEFDRFVAPLLDGRKDEVDQLMWALRDIIQQSERISLLLAGSGLQRIFLRYIEDPLWGSIAEVELEIFDREQDKDAIEAIFLPSTVRERLCPSERRRVVVTHAYEICGGRPYFLAMLGYASAKVSNGHPLTPALLNRVVESMIHGKAGTLIKSEKFYGHIFETCKLLPKTQENIAKIMMVHIAELTTQENQWLSKSEAVEVPELAQIEHSERVSVLNALSDEQALEFDDHNARVRISVPITATALREDGNRIRQDALLELESQRE
jgi:hypothetical protein